MENTEKTMTSEESLRVIQEMIQSTKKDFENDSFHYLLWGWLVFIASLGNYILMNIDYSNPGIVWLLMPLGAVIATVYGFKQKKEKKVRTYVGDFILYAVIAMVISLVIVLSFQLKLQLYTYPVLMILYAIMLFITGGALQFKPLIYGGIVNWILAITAFFAEFQSQLLILALAVLLGYIIPGYLLKKRSEASN